ncbi:MAG: UDP-N-acetylmuramoyl-L-alanine--D-glutamate ligase [Lachnospiraceae bacterium]|jgi:UDP-N-acetylmuramoylalanine--D-glutamate ligase
MDNTCNDLCESRKWLVIGAGKSGIAAAKLLLANGAAVVLYDDNKDVDTEKFSDGMTFSLGHISDDILNTIDEAVISPGISLEIPLAVRCKKCGIKVISEIELAYRFDKGIVAAITGTNGKTTTTTLLGEIMKTSYDNVIVAGNIGNPYTEQVMDSDDKSCSVLEVSSFQLETVETFRPHVSAVLNITPDHLNRHHTMENYIDCKFNIAKGQKEDDYIVLNYEDMILRERADKLIPKVIYFSSKRELENGVYLNGSNEICVKMCGEEEVICNTDELILPGVHNYENVMAAVAMARLMGISYENIRNAVKSFKSVEHRIEYVCEKDGVIYYNDSKGTNPDAAIKGICSMTRPTFLIGGGYDKGSDYDEWINEFHGRVKKLVIIGETKDKIADTCDRLGFKDYVRADSFEEAVGYCINNSVSGDAVLLSPACASWDMFKSYEERGRIFKKLVLEN